MNVEPVYFARFVVHDQRFTHYPTVVVADFSRYYPSALLLRLGREPRQFVAEAAPGRYPEIGEPQVGKPYSAVRPSRTVAVMKRHHAKARA